MLITSAASDLASQRVLTQRGTQTRTALDQVSQELATGQKSDLVAATHGDLGALFGIERALVRLSSQSEAMEFAGAKSAMAQLRLGELGAAVAPFGVDLTAALKLQDYDTATTISQGARAAFDAAVSALNGRYGPHALFAGAALGGPALIDSDAIYADLAALANGAADGLDAIAAINTYFDAPGGGFETGAYIGALTDAPQVETSANARLSFSVRADEPAIRQVLKSLALVALAGSGDHPGGDADARLMLRAGADLALDAPGAIVTLRAEIGHAQDRIEDALASTAAQRNALDINRNAVIAADPYEAASRFQALQGQMEMIYEITARMANLRLVNHLR